MGLLSDSGETNETDVNISEIYDLNVFIPTVSGHEKVVESGTYFTVSNSSDVQVVLLVDNKKEIQILKETGLFGLSSTRIKDVYFITNENFSMTTDGINETVSSPVILPLEYAQKESSRDVKLILEENFSGILVYTMTPMIGSNSFSVNDGTQAVQIILSEDYETGNRLFGKPSPNPDSIQTDSNGQKILTWNAPIGNVSVKYYKNSAPFYFTLASIVLLALIGLIWFRYQYQIRKLRQITHLSDPNSEEGFRNKK
ncbi:MAG: DUF5803 family protein [Methanimicrococcus sp.]|nr:DUF5803 family protein [Methanimicrococcus sp.]